MGHTIGSYERGFETARKEAGSSFIVSGDTCVVVSVPQDELVSKSRILISDGGVNQVNSMKAKRPVLVRVLEVGPGHYDEETGKEISADAEVGDILLVGINAVTEISQFGRLMNHGRLELGLCNASQALIRWRGQGAFDTYFQALLREVESE